MSLVPPLAAALLLGCGGGESRPTPKGYVPPPFDYPLDKTLRINHLQAKATHNSYHIETPGSTVPDWDYTHAPLDVQLQSQGVRGFELDTRYVEEDDDFEVFHLGTIDEQTTCRRFVDCLSTLKKWSDHFPAHHPLLVMIEPKDAPPEADPEGYFSKMEGEILSVWPRERIVTPDGVKGSAPTLREAVTTKGWPTLGESRGKILFFINNTDTFRDPYTHGGKDLDGRLMFVESSPGDPFAAVLILNDPQGDQAAIQAGIAQGFLVRTFADGAGHVAEAEPALALSSGANAVSTDYPEPSDSSMGYSLQIPGGTPSRCNPRSAPPECTAEAIEDPKFFTAAYP